MMAAKSTIRIDDYRTTEGYAQRNPAIVSLVEQGRARSAMQVPLLKDGEVVGAMTIYRPEVRPFGDQEATLAEDFAKQAVIAIENARLLTELRESLEQQQAMAEMLQRHLRHRPAISAGVRRDARKSIAALRRVYGGYGPILRRRLLIGVARRHMPARILAVLAYAVSARGPKRAR